MANLEDFDLRDNEIFNCLWKLFLSDAKTENTEAG